MLRIPRILEIVFRLAPMLLFAGIASAQCPANDAKPLPPNPLMYPITSDQYAVQYQVGGGGWTNARVYISVYGETIASPDRGDSGYTAGTTSMSFVSIPARANALVHIRVTKLSTGPFQIGDRVSVRPTPKLVDVERGKDGTVQLSTVTTGNFDGEQFILMWNHGSDGGGVEGLAFFLDPPYTEPIGSDVKRVTSAADLSDLKGIDTLDFEPPAVVPPATLPAPIQIGAYQVPDRILNVFLGPNVWVQGKLRFTVKNATRKIYGPGVLDGSQFSYLNRNCVINDPGAPDDGFPTDDGLYSLSSQGMNGNLNNFIVDGIIISDQNHAANDPFFSSTVNNVKTIGWNSNNAALRLNDSTTASNVFIRSGDDSLMIWGSHVTVTNATVWQDYNGGVVSLGWSDNSVGDYNMVDGLWVVKTDWLAPTAQSWKALSQPGPPNPLQNQNNAVIASLMIPSTEYGTASPPVFRNIYVEDPPQVLFSIKIDAPVNCNPSTCMASFLTNLSTVKLKIENLYSPQSIVKNSIGFETIPKGFYANAADAANHISYFPTDYILKGYMNIDLTNVLIKLPNGFILPLINEFDAFWVGKVLTNGPEVKVNYNLSAPDFFAH